jgi:hypothetical protein
MQLESIKNQIGNFTGGRVGAFYLWPSTGRRDLAAYRQKPARSKQLGNGERVKVMP